MSLSHFFRPRVSPGSTRRGQAGQALPLFVLSLVVLTGSVAIVTDVSSFWVVQQQMQRAADAAALAGAIYLPGNTASAYSTAQAEATKNGYTNGVGGVTITPLQDSSNRRRLNVTITGPARTYFAGVVGLTSVTITVKSHGEYVLPVPMGSPQNYYGVGYLVGATSTTSSSNGDSGWQTSGASGSGWTNPGNADGNDNDAYAVSSTSSGSTQQWGTGFSMATALPTPSANQTMTFKGLEVELRAVLSGSGSTTTSCQLNVEVSWNSGTSWSTVQTITPLATTETLYTLGSASSFASWGGHAWTQAEFSNMRVRLTFNQVSCSSTRSVSVDTLRVRVSYALATTTTTASQQPVISPTGSVLAPQNFWGAMQSQGVPSIQGDSYMTKYEIRTGTLNSTYDPDAYYNYGVDFPAGSSNGQVWLFDPGFCDVSTKGGTGEYWTGDNSSDLPISAYYDLYNTRGTPYDLSDDLLVASSGDTFERQDLSDPTLATAAGGYARTGHTDCAGTSWHNNWWQLASGLAGNVNYRLHTFTTDPNSANDQNDSTGLNSFAVWSTASGGTPRVYGIGAMESYVRLPPGQVSEFYLAQIDAVHAGKSLVIELWDPGDTGALSASLEFLQPTSNAYSPASFSYTATKGTTHTSSSNCTALTGTNVTSVTTNTGGASRFNGCWITITITLPTSYSAPHPASDTLTAEPGWWKIRYTMGSQSTNYSTDLTTWKVSIRGNPVHLVPGT